MLRHLPPSSKNVLLNLFNNIWLSGNFPPQWRKAIIIPLPKPGKDTTRAINYRPIALTSCLCKTMERMINDRLVWYLERNNIISRYQSGFRKNRSTLDNLIRLETHIREGFIQKAHTVAIFFDIEKAYDTTWKYGILKDIYNCGLRGRLPVFIRGFLEDRSFRVRLGSTLSDLHPQEMGVPQGSVLSVTLFSLKINSIVDCLPRDVQSSLFVDDFLIYYSSCNMAIIERKLQLCLNKLSTWADTNGFRFSKNKTVCVHFCNLRNIHPDPEIFLNGEQVPTETETKFLGLIFDKKLNFKNHIRALKIKCTQTMNLLKTVCKKSWGADRTTLMKLYRALIRSKLDYGCVVYGAARPSYLLALDPCHHQGMRIALGAFRTSPVQSLYAESGEPPLSLRRKKLALQYYTKLSANKNNPAYNAVFAPRYMEAFQNKTSAIPTFGIRARRLAEDAGFEVENSVAHINLPQTPPWLFTRPNINLALTKFKKADTDPLTFKTKYLEVCSDYTGYTQIFTDGSKDTDRVAYAAVGVTFSTAGRVNAHSSVYTAELKAINAALEYISQSDGKKFVLICDSLSCLQAIQNARWENPCILEILLKLNNLQRIHTEVIFIWVPSHVGIGGNERADQLAKAALQYPEVTGGRIPFTDLKSAIIKFIDTKFQNMWDLETNNKLHNIEPILKNIKPSQLVRKDDSVLTRCKLGHTHLTHGFLLRRERAPECPHCNCLLTVKHILIDCQFYADIRRQYYTASTLQEVFNDSTSAIINFVKAINIYHKI
jgi:ribonuclease HI